MQADDVVANVQQEQHWRKTVLGVERIPSYAGTAKTNINNYWGSLNLTKQTVSHSKYILKQYYCTFFEYAWFQVQGREVQQICSLTEASNLKSKPATCEHTSPSLFEFELYCNDQLALPYNTSAMRGNNGTRCLVKATQASCGLSFIL